MLTRRQFALTPAAMALSLRGAPQSKRNVLYLSSDDLNISLGCYGDPVTKSPHIDRLAARGIRFDRSYCNFPLCNPSRTSLLSGKRPETTGILDNDTPPRTHMGDVLFMPEYFRSHGYFTARVGKIAHGDFEDSVKWDIAEAATNGSNAKPAGEPFAPGMPNGKIGADRDDSSGPRQPDRGPLAWLATDNHDEDEPDGHTARRIVQLIEQNRHKPFFIGCGFHRPHLQFVAPRKYFEMYRASQIQVPYAPPDDRADIPPIALTHGLGDQNLTDTHKRQAIAGYHAATTFMDAQVGYVLDAVDRLQLWESTVVIMLADHGWHLGEHLGLWRKNTLFEEATRVPLIIAAPGMKQGMVTTRLVEYVDVYPTLLELAGLPLPDGLEGASLLPLIENPEHPWKEAVFSCVSRGKLLGRSIRTNRYRYTEWGSDQGAELYDHRTDSKEFTNLAVDPKHAALVAEMRGRLRAGWQSYRPKI